MNMLLQITKNINDIAYQNPTKILYLVSFNWFFALYNEMNSKIFSLIYKGGDASKYKDNAVKKNFHIF